MKKKSQHQGDTSPLTPVRSSEYVRQCCTQPEGGTTRGHGLPKSSGYPDDVSFNKIRQDRSRVIRAGKK